MKRIREYSIPGYDWRWSSTYGPFHGQENFNLLSDALEGTEVGLGLASGHWEHSTHSLAITEDLEEKLNG